MSGQIQYGPADVTTSDQTPPAVQEHFACAVRLGRRRADPFGYLVLTGEYLQFRGGRDIEVAWPTVASIVQVDRAIVISLRNTRRLLYVCCTSADNAARGAAVARDLMMLRTPQFVALA